MKSIDDPMYTSSIAFSRVLKRYFPQKDETYAPLLIFKSLGIVGDDSLFIQRRCKVVIIT